MPSENRMKYLMESTGQGYSAYVVDGRVYQSSPGTSGLTWTGPDEWNAAVSESGVVHDAIVNTDYDDAALLRQGALTTVTTGRVAHYPLQEDAGTTVYDVAGNHNGNATGATPNVAGPLGGSAWSFDGVDDYIGLGEPAAFETQQFSHVAWMNTAVSGVNGKVYCVERGRYPNSIYQNLGVNNDVAHGVVTFGDGTRSSLQGTTTLTDGSWHQIAHTYDGTAHRVYVDGVEEAAENVSKTVAYYSGQEVEIGRRGGGNYFEGRIADVRHYDHALSANEISSLAESYRQGTATLATKSFGTAQTPDLSAEYALNGTTATIDVIGSPGTADEETQSATLDGSTSFGLTWTNSHTDFRIAVSLGDDTTVVEAAPTITSLTLS